MIGTKQKGMVEPREVLLVLILPLLLMICTYIYGSMELSSQENFYAAITGETVNLTANDTYVNLANSPLVNDAEYPVALYNSTTTLVEDTDYAIDYTDGKVKTINNKTGVYSINYNHMGGESYLAFDDTNEKAYAAFGLAKILPLVVVGALVVGLLLKVFVF